MIELKFTGAGLGEGMLRMIAGMRIAVTAMLMMPIASHNQEMAMVSTRAQFFFSMEPIPRPTKIIPGTM